MRLFSDLIDAFARAEGPPPTRLLAFMRWALKGAFPAIGIGFLLSIAVGATEVGSAAVVGWLIDLAQSRGPDGLIAESWPWLLAAAGFFLILRPGLLGAGAALNGLTLGPNLYPLVLSRLNRHTLGQSLSFFDDDFAGRIAQKQQQTARAITDAVSEFGQHPRSRGHRDHRSGGDRRQRQPLAGAGDGGVARRLRRADPPLHAAHPRPLEGARRRPCRRHRPGRRHHHQHRHRQALQPRHVRGPGGAEGARRLPRRHHRLRRDQHGLPLLADGSRGRPAGRS